MIPLRDVIPSRTTPYVTITIILLNALAWFYEITMPEPVLTQFLYVYGIVPVDFSPATLITSMFLHGSWMHVIGNMWYLWIFGDNVEDRLGHGLFTIFYFLCGLAATFAQLMFSAGSHVPNLGASGAIAGVLGAYLILFPQGRVRVLQRGGVVQVPALMVIGLWIVLQLFSGIGSISNTANSGGVAYMAHIGGFLAGCVLTMVLGGRRRGAMA